MTLGVRVSEVDEVSVPSLRCTQTCGYSWVRDGQRPMCIVDLTKRITSDWHQFNQLLKSCDSKIYFESGIPDISDPPGSVDLCVGSRWYDPSQQSMYTISDSGIEVGSRSCVVIEVGERISLPHNVMGLVTGKGRYIFQSAMISTGKIDPGFDGRLRIGFYNASDRSITLEPGMPFCSCCFFNTETEAKNPKRYETEPTPPAVRLPRGVALRRLLEKNWHLIVPIAVSIVSLIVSTYVAVYVKKA